MTALFLKEPFAAAFGKNNETTPTTMQSPGECRGGSGSLFLGLLDQGLVGHAESTHVNRPKGKALLVP